jgi:hypothetical protein
MQAEEQRVELIFAADERGERGFAGRVIGCHRRSDALIAPSVKVAG